MISSFGETAAVGWSAPHCISLTVDPSGQSRLLSFDMSVILCHTLWIRSSRLLVSVAFFPERIWSVRQIRTIRIIIRISAQDLERERERKREIGDIKREHHKAGYAASHLRLPQKRPFFTLLPAAGAAITVQTCPSCRSLGALGPARLLNTAHGEKDATNRCAVAGPRLQGWALQQPPSGA